MRRRNGMSKLRRLFLSESRRMLQAVRLGYGLDSIPEGQQIKIALRTRGMLRNWIQCTNGSFPEP